MRLLVTSAVAVAGIVAGMSGASACEWYHQQVMASAAQPAQAAPTVQPPAAATMVDPAMLAYLDRPVAPPVSPAASEDVQAK